MTCGLFITTNVDKKVIYTLLKLKMRHVNFSLAGSLVTPNREYTIRLMNDHYDGFINFVRVYELGAALSYL
jgi:hypothetical protein